MRSFLLLLSFGVISLLGSMSPAFAEDKNESLAETKEWTAYHLLDRQVTEIYQKILIAIPTPAAREKFTEAQNAWLKFRGIQGEFAAVDAPDKETGKLRMAVSFSATTQARIDELKKLQDSSTTK